MRTREDRRSRLTALSAIGLAVALCLLRSGTVSGDENSESWKEPDGGGAPLPGGAPTNTPDSPTPKPVPTNTPVPTATPKPTPEPKAFKTTNEYACAKVGKGDAVDPVTKESAADKARREWERANTDRSSKGGRPVPPPSKTPLPANATPYMKMCDAAGVPLPPKWGDDAWVKQGNLPTDKTFASNAPTTEVWTSKTPDGICYALPRIDGTPPVIQLLGQICQSSKTGKACFWDNIDPKNPTLSGREPVTNDSGQTNMAGGDTLKLPEGEQCTACHRGDNVFIIHPGTPLQRGPTDPCSTDGPFDMPIDDRPTDTAKKPKFYEPIAPNFTNPKNEPLDPPLTNKACTGCHSIPKLTTSYCSTVLLPFMAKEMPPPDGTKDAEDQKSADELKARCAALAKKSP